MTTSYNAHAFDAVVVSRFGGCYELLPLHAMVTILFFHKQVLVIRSLFSNFGLHFLLLCQNLYFFFNRLVYA